MLLKDVALRSAKARDKPYRLNDGNGLYLSIHPNGGKYWQFRFCFNDKEKLLSIGVYPEVSLQEARERRDDARKLLRDGKDPAHERKAAKQRRRAETEHLFKTVALEWHAKRAAIWTKRHSEKMLEKVRKGHFP